MASIIVNKFKKSVSSDVEYTYSDIHLDITKYPMNAPRDILSDKDLDAIKNSLNNLFTTLPGQKLLSPNYGVNLTQFLFEPVTSTTANFIGETILNSITRFEPRLVVDKVKVSGNVDNNEYNIVLSIRAPKLTQKDNIQLSAVLSKNSIFTFI